ncbi:MAG: hypothetical protein ACRD3G_15055 [Vicinamibacterales bacterium]
MRAIAPFAVIALVTALMTATGAAAVAHVTLTVRLYNTGRVPAAALLLARDTATAILADGGLSIRVRHCGSVVSPAAVPDRCAEPLKPAEVVMRVLDAPAFTTSVHPDAFGVSYVVQDTDRGWLATVFADRVRDAAARAGASHGALLGRVMAHELGHLLLGSGYHGSAGVMRAHWPDAILTRNGAEWRFSGAEAARMRDVLASIAGDATQTKPGQRDSDNVVALSARLTPR